MSSPPSSTIEEKGQRSSFIARDVVDMVPVSWDTISWLECGNFHTRPFLGPTRAGLMNMVIMGNHSINGPAPTSCGFLRDPSTTIAVHQIQSSNGGNGFLNPVGLYLRKERILRRPPLVCEGGLYGGSCPPLLKAATLSEDPSPHNNNNGVLCAVTIFTTPPIMGQCFQSVIPSFLRQNSYFGIK